MVLSGQKRAQRLVGFFGNRHVLSLFHEEGNGLFQSLVFLRGSECRVFG